METKNLLEDAIEDEDESDVEETNTLGSDKGQTTKPIQVLGYSISFYFLCIKTKEKVENIG